MLAARDQENLVHVHQTAGGLKSLNQSTRMMQPKTPGNRYPKTPLKVPLHDENAPAGFRGESAKGNGLENLVTGGKKGAAFDRNAFVTPMGPRVRAPLGMKTTNAKAKAFQTPAGTAPGQDLDKTKAKQTSARRPKRVTHPETIKLEVHGDESPLTEREVEYAPPKPKDLPYESEDFPNGCLNYDALKPGNIMRGWQELYNNRVDENGVSKTDREDEQNYSKSAKETDERVLKMLEEEDWTVGDVPETFRHIRERESENRRKAKAAEQIKKSTILPNRGPPTIAARKAAAVLSVAPKAMTAPPKSSQPKPTTSFLARKKVSIAPPPVNTSAMRHTAAAAASRSTIGYTKGRSASSVLQRREGGMPRSVSNLSDGSDTTITPSRYAQKEASMGSDEWARLKFLTAFDVDDDDLEPGLMGALPECLRRDEEDEEFLFPSRA